MKVFISQPMRDLTVEEVLDRRLEIFISFCQMISHSHPDLKIELIDSYKKNVLMDICDIDKRSVWCLGDSIKLMAEADLVIFDASWREARGCCIEHEICERYGIPNTEYENHSFTLSYLEAFKEVM